MQDLALLTAVEQARLIRTRKASALEVVEASLARIHDLNGRLNAFITIMDEEARQGARRADRAVKRGLPLGPLHGVPVALKDNFETRGVRTTAGSRVLEDYVPDRDATVVERLRQAGAIIVGKTHLHEFASGPPPVFGPVRNPWDLKRTSGGSSNGSGVAVSTSMCPVAMGHDTGGSGRIPASFCGAVGLIATYGRISRCGIIPTAWSMDHAAPMARAVRDAAAVLSAVSGHDPRDPASSTARVPAFARGIGGGVAGVRIGLPKEWFFDLVEPEVKAAVQEGVRALESAGARAEQVSIPLVPHCMDIGGPIIGAESAACREEAMDRWPEKFGPELLQRLRVARLIPATRYLRAQRLRRLLRQQFLQALQRVDVLVTPTTPGVAPLVEAREAVIDGKAVPMGYALAAFTYPYDLTGLPAISVPCGFTSGGLPIGMQIGGRPWEEATVLRVAHAFEQSTDWHKSRPPVEA